MVQAKTLTTLAVATLIGAGLGVHLGRSAIGAVDPLYFADPDGTRSYAELVPAASLSRPWSSEVESASADHGWPASCVGCGPDRTVYEPAPQDAFQSAWTPPAETSPQYAVLEAEPDMEAEIDGASADLEDELQRVERYAYYPVSDEAALAHRNAMTAVVGMDRSGVPEAEPGEPQEPLIPQGMGKISRY